MKLVGTVVSLQEKSVDGVPVFEGVFKLVCTPLNNLEISRMRDMQCGDEIALPDTDISQANAEEEAHFRN